MRIPSHILTKTVVIMAFLGLATSFTGCVKDYSVTVSSQDLRFGLASESQTFVVNANCKWSITQNDDADWYTISPMSGKANDSIVTVTVNDYSHGDYRSSSFVVASSGGHIRRTVFVSQNKMDFYGIVNKVYGVMSREKWNTDYYGQIIEDEYKRWDYNPYDTTRGYLMYFFEDGVGLQRDHHTDTVAWWPFRYTFVPDSLILHIDFETVDGAPESYAPNVLTASDSLYRFIHEYKPHWWERVDMRKVGTIHPEEAISLRRKATKRRGGESVFMD